MGEAWKWLGLQEGLQTDMNWQPIETAPHPSVGESFLVAVQPMGDPARPYHVGEAQRFDGVWYWAGNDPADSWGGPISPTHWMPMPAPPRAPLADADGPGEEDGPWADGWEQRSALQSTGAQE